MKGTHSEFIRLELIPARMGNNPRRHTHDHQTDETRRERVPMRAHVRVREYLIRKNTVEGDERHHRAGDDQPLVGRSNELEGSVRLRWSSEHANLSRQQHGPNGH